MINKIQFLSFVHLSKIETFANFISALKHFVSMALFGILLISYYIYLHLIFDILQFEILSLMSWIFFLVWTEFLQATQAVKIHLIKLEISKIKYREDRGSACFTKFFQNSTNFGSKKRNFIDWPSINLLFFLFRWMILVPSMERDLRHNSKEPPRGSRGSTPTTPPCSTPSGLPQRRQPPRGSMYTITTMEATTSSHQGRICEIMSWEQCKIIVYTCRYPP